MAEDTLVNARYAAAEAAYQLRVRASHERDTRSQPEDYAEAASDVWEPLVRDALRAIEICKANIRDNAGWIRYDDAQEVTKIVARLNLALRDD